MDKQKVIMLLVTYKCNLRCSYCYEPKVSNFKMSAAKAKSIIQEQIKALGDNYEAVEIHLWVVNHCWNFRLSKNVPSGFGQHQLLTNK